VKYWHPKVVRCFRIIELTSFVTCRGEKSIAYRCFWRRAGWKIKPIGTLSRRRWEDIIKVGFKEAGMGGADWIHLTAGRIPVPGYCGYSNVLRD
jgi:hypothetical protein